MRENRKFSGLNTDQSILIIEIIIIIIIITSNFNGRFCAFCKTLNCHPPGVLGCVCDNKCKNAILSLVHSTPIIQEMLYFYSKSLITKCGYKIAGFQDFSSINLIIFNNII